MNAKVYLLLDIVDEDCGSVMRSLGGQLGVVTLDQLEGKPNLIVSVEAADRQALAELMMPLLRFSRGTRLKRHIS